jgi:hypothetical protein
MKHILNGSRRFSGMVNNSDFGEVGGRAGGRAGERVEIWWHLVAWCLVCYIAALYPLATIRCSLLTAHCSLLTAHCSLLALEWLHRSTNNS